MDENNNNTIHTEENVKNKIQIALSLFGSIPNTTKIEEILKERKERKAQTH